MKKTIQIAIILFFLSLGQLFAQGVVQKAAEHQAAFPVEKIYLSLDRNYYAAGDTLWFKVTTVNGKNTGTNTSERVFVELFNDSASLVERKIIPISNGLGNGDFSFPSDLPEGTYTIRAYTHWQRNFDADYMYNKSFFLANGSKNWRVRIKQDVEWGTSPKLNIAARITDARNLAIGNRTVLVSLWTGGKISGSQTAVSDAEGRIQLKMPFSGVKGEDAILRITDKKIPLNSTSIPVYYNEKSVADLQFLPEGGHLVNGLFSKVAFKAMGADGRSRDVKGVILNRENKIVADLASHKDGMGSFRFLPDVEDSYLAEIESPAGKVRFPLPQIVKSGTTLSVDNLSKQDTVLVSVKAAGENMRRENYQLLAQTADSIAFGIKVNLQKGFFTLKIPTVALPEGVVHFTLFDPEQRPLNARAIYISLKKNMDVGIAIPNIAALYSPVNFDLNVTDEQGLPVRGTFSVSVTNDNQVFTDDLQRNIKSYFLLESNVKGKIENPGWYFKQDDSTTRVGLDNLLLTQGWIGFNWDNINAQPSPKFNMEVGSQVSGYVTNMLKKPVAGILVSLMSFGKNFFVADTVTDAEGKFAFNDLPVSDSASYLVKIKKANGKSSGATIHMNEFRPSTLAPEINTQSSVFLQPDSLLMQIYQTAKKRTEQADYEKSIREGQSIKQVEIKGEDKRLTPELRLDTKLFKQISEKDLFKTPQTELMSLIKSYIPEFRSSSIGGVDTFFVGSGGVISLRADQKPVQREFWRSFFNYINAEDVKDVRVYKQPTFGRGSAFAYLIEIDTRSGNGPWTNRARGNQVFRPAPIYLAKTFYVPKFQDTRLQSATDIRPTIFWNADVITDESGKARISFNSNAPAGSYTIKVEGTDLMGRFGYSLGHFVRQAKTQSK